MTVMQHATLVQEFVYGSAVGLHTSLVVPNHLVGPADAQLLDSIHGMLAEDIPAAKLRRLERFVARSLEAMGKLVADGDAVIPSDTVVTRICQVFHEG